MKIITELKKHFCADGIHRVKLAQLKSLRKRYPNSPLLELAINLMRKKIWLFPGREFLSENFLRQLKGVDNKVLTINGVKFKLNDAALRRVFLFEYTDLFSADDNFRNNYSSEPLFDEIMSILFEMDGPYQYGEVVLNEADVVIDAGSNMGVFALLAAKHKKCKVYAFEPNPAMTFLINENVASNNLNEKITVIPFGLSNVTCDVKFKVSSCIGDSSIFMETERYQCIKGEEILSHCVSLDDWVKENKIPKIDFIKADIEGAERLLLQGATEVLRTMQPKISVCTYHLPDDPQVLEKIILDANPNYIVIHGEKKLYAYVKQ